MMGYDRPVWKPCQRGKVLTRNLNIHLEIEIEDNTKIHYVPRKNKTSQG